MATANRKNHFKVVLLGEGCVGKTSLVLRYVQDKFNDKHLTTLQASFLNRRLNIDGKRVNLAIWDTAGQERFHALGPIYYRDSHGAVLVYDITDEDSFQKVKNWVKELRKMLGDEISLCIAGNKIDLEKDRHVQTSEAEEYSRSVGAKHYHTTAKLNKGIEEMFLDLTKQALPEFRRAPMKTRLIGRYEKSLLKLYEVKNMASLLRKGANCDAFPNGQGMMQKQAEDEAEIASNPKSSKARDQSMKRKNVVIVDEEPKTKSKGGCC